MKSSKEILDSAESFLETADSYVILDKPRVNLLSYDPSIQSLSLNYIRSKYHFFLKTVERSREQQLDESLFNQFLADIAVSRGDLAVFDRGHIHFKLNCTRVGTNDILRHYSMRFFQTGQRKQIDLNVLDSEDISQSIRYFLPPEWVKARDLAEEFNSAMSYVAHLVKHAIDLGMPSDQARYIIPNAATTTLEMSGSLRSFFSYVGLRACEQAQFENQFLSEKVAKKLKEILPDLTQKLGPRCVYDPRCREGKNSCGKIKEKRDLFVGDGSGLEYVIKRAQMQIDSIDEIEFNNQGFLSNLSDAYNEYVSLEESNELPLVELEARFNSGISNLEEFTAQLAKNTFKRYTGKTFASDDKLTIEQVANICRNIVKAGHYGALGHQHLSYDTKISRVMLQKFARHHSLVLMASSQHHSIHANFEYIMPPMWEKLGLGTEFHTIVRYLNNLYTRAMDAGIPRDQARYCLPTCATTNLMISASPRSLFSLAAQRTCPSNSWEEREIVSMIVDDARERYSNLFYYLGPKCLLKLCGAKCEYEDEVRNKYLVDGDE